VTLRVGVLADTHCPEFLPALPERVFELLRGVDLILHAGDVAGPGGGATLAALAAIAPVEAVRGDHDRALPQLPDVRVVEVEGRRITLVHGHRSHLIEEPFTLIGTLTLGLFWPSTGLVGRLRRRFPDSDAIVHGHTHAATIDRGGPGLVFNPGAVYQVDPQAALDRLGRNPDWFEWSWRQFARHRLTTPRPSVGILTVPPAPAPILAEILPL
jgi:putative phosphoesterase